MTTTIQTSQAPQPDKVQELVDLLEMELVISKENLEPVVCRILPDIEALSYEEKGAFAKKSVKLRYAYLRCKLFKKILLDYYIERIIRQRAKSNDNLMRAQQNLGRY